jgi:molecular chaperone GrpE
LFLVTSDMTKAAISQLDQLDKSELIDRHIRLVADHRRVVKRGRDERLDARADEKKRVLASFLEVYDAVELGLTQADCAVDCDEAFRSGLQTVRDQLLHTLAAHGAAPFGARGDAFDPALHEAAGLAADPDLAEDTVVHVVRAGFRIGDDLLRPARVIVARAPARVGVLA